MGEFIPGKLLFEAIREYNTNATELVTTSINTSFLEWLVKNDKISCEQLGFKKIHHPQEMYCIGKRLESYGTGPEQAYQLDKLIYTRSIWLLIL